MRIGPRTMCLGFATFAVLLCTGLISQLIVTADSDVAPRSAASGQREQDVPDEYIWPPEQQRQREEAIRKHDSSLLPECTSEYFAWRDAAKAAGKLNDRPLSMDFWARPGCNGKPDGEVRGPASEPGPHIGSPVPGP